MAESGPAMRGSGEEGGALSPSSLIHRTDLWVTVILLAFCGTAYYLTTTFDEVSPLFQNNIPPTCRRCETAARNSKGTSWGAFTRRASVAILIASKFC